MDGQRVHRLYGTPLGSNFIEDPVQGMVRFIPDSLAWLRGILGVWVGILAATILVIATNAGLIGVSRLAYSLGQHRQVPPILGRVHPKRLTPYVSIIVFGVVACLIILPGSTSLPGRPLRLRRHDLVHGRPRVRGRAALQGAGSRAAVPDAVQHPVPRRSRCRSSRSSAAIGTFTVWCVVVATHAEGRLIGFTWMGARPRSCTSSTAGRKGYSLTRTVAKVIVPESMQADIDYDQILVPIVGSRVTDEMMVLACQLATEKKSSIDGLYVIEVPLNLPLDARLVERARARRTRCSSAAALIADQFKVKFTPHVVTARQAGRAIVEEAASGARRSSSSARRASVASLIDVFGRTVDYVLDHAPCEVLFNLVPKGYPTGGSGESPKAAHRRHRATTSQPAPPCRRPQSKRARAPK